MFKLVTIILAMIALLLTFSRSAIIVGILASVWVTWNKYRATHRIGVFQKIAFVGSSVALLLITYHISRITVSFTEESFVVRQQLNVAALSMWQSSPLFGVGLGNFLVELPKHLVSRDVYFLQPVHNIYLLLLAETGIIGLAFFLWLLWVIGEKAIRDTRYVRRKNKNALHITYHISLITLLLLGLVDHYPITLQQGQLLLTILLVLK